MSDKPAKKATGPKGAGPKATGPKKSAATRGPRPADDQELDRLVGGAHHDPHSILGAHVHPVDGGVGHVTVRALRPGAEKVTVAVGDEQTEMQHERHGIWVAQLDREQVPDYRLLVDYGDGFEHRQDDPYRYLPTLGEMDLHLIGEGRDRKSVV